MTEKNCIYLIDRAYVDYKKFDQLTKDNIFFVTRLKENAVIEEYQNLAITFSEDPSLDEDFFIISDKVVYLGNPTNYKTEEKYRLVTVNDSTGRTLTFLTNIFNLSSQEIGFLYKKRWDIELFFKWIKQHLKVKKVIGYSFNAIMIQLITAIITYILLLLAQQQSNFTGGLLKLKRKIKCCINTLIDTFSFTWAKWLNTG